jgi:hypothetical protein
MITVIVIETARGDAGIQMCPVTLHILPGITHLAINAKKKTSGTEGSDNMK